jgi:hypothetical protein
MLLYTATIILTTTLPFASANGCFSGGETYNQVGSHSDIVHARHVACNKMSGSFNANQLKIHCASFSKSGNRINFSVKNNLDNSAHLTQNECLAAFTIEMNACDHGSEQDHGSFHYKDDPNAGKCR